MSQAVTVARLATRELFMTFRLLLILLASAGAGAVAGLLPAPPGLMTLLAAGFGLAIVVAAAVAAWSLAEERFSGRIGWLITRSVSRATYLVGWYGALLLVAVGGLAAGGFLGWLSIPPGSVVIDATEYVAAIVGVAATCGLALAVGLLAGALLRPRGAMLVTIALCAIATILVVLLPGSTAWLPGGALVALAAASEIEPVVDVALRAAGVGLVMAAGVLVVCQVVLERTDL